MYDRSDKETVVKVLRDVLYGHYYIDKESRVLDLDKHRNVLKAIGDAVSFLDEPATEKDSWLRNLLLEIGILPLNEDLNELEKNLQIALDTINPDYAKAILLNYKDNVSFAEIGRQLDTPSSTVRKRIKAGVDLLKRKERIQLIYAGAQLAKTSQQLEQEVIDGINRMNEQLSDGTLPEVNIEDIDNESIAILGLSNRPLLALKRHGLNHMGDLRRMTRDRLLTIKGLGRGSAKEIMEKSSLYGIIIPLHDDMIR